MTVFASGTTAYWYLTRGAGTVSLILLTAVVLLGILGAVGYTDGERWPRFAISSLHRDISLLAVAVLVIHIVTTVLDSFAPISLLDAVIPFVSAYRPIWLGLGALAFDLVIALVLTSLLRRRIGYRTWRGVHWLAYASWPVAVLHGLGTGSDSKQLWLLAITAACVAAVGCAVLVRVMRDERLSDGRRGLALAAPIVAALGIAVFVLLGPLAANWSERAGTPAALLPHTVLAGRPTKPVTVPRSTARAVSLKLPFDAGLSGSVRQSAAAGGAFVDLTMAVSGGANGELRVRLAGQPNGGGLSLTGSQVDLALHGLPVVMAGQITQLSGEQFVAKVSAVRQTPLELDVQLRIDNQTGSVTGTMHGLSLR